MFVDRYVYIYIYSVYILICIYIYIMPKAFPNTGTLHDGFPSPETAGQGLTGTVIAGPDGQGRNLALASYFCLQTMMLLYNIMLGLCQDYVTLGLR